jgi:hypothetical protein
MDPRNPQTRVCGIAELVEAILHEAEMSLLDLILARRINRTFNDVILHALPFRRALFLEADESRTLVETDPSNVQVNPFLEKIFPAGAKHFFDLVFGRTEDVHIWTEGRDVLVGPGQSVQAMLFEAHRPCQPRERALLSPSTDPRNSRCRGLLHACAVVRTCIVAEHVRDEAGLARTCCRYNSHRPSMAYRAEDHPGRDCACLACRPGFILRYGFPVGAILRIYG